MKDLYCYIIAGSNGSGKTTFAMDFLPHYAKCVNFVNADLIARGISPFIPEKVSLTAGRMALEKINELIDKRENIAIETTLSGKTYFSLFKKMKEIGYSMNLFYLWIPDLEIAKKRVAKRVENGGHDVPVKDIERRFKRSLENFEIYSEIMDLILFFNNSNEIPELIFEKINDKINVHNNELYLEIIK